jgi:fumarate hydratase subunit alpha
MIRKIEQLVAQANFSLRKDVLHLLKKAYLRERNQKAKKALGWILENAKIAVKENLAICQDTGLPIIFIEAGRDIKVSSILVSQIERGVQQGYVHNHLRPSIVNPLQRGNPSYEGLISHVHFSTKGKGLKITLFPKGFGSENKSVLNMFNPTASYDEIEQFIVNSVRKAGPEACPPFVVGIGIGSSADGSLSLAKKALIDNVDKPNRNSLLNKMEIRLLSKINDLNIGPMGLGGKNTALAVKIKSASTHIAGLPVGINISCWALRSATIKFTKLQLKALQGCKQ